MLLEYTRQSYDFEPFPFVLVNQDDHATPVPDASVGLYYISKDGAPFTRGLGGVRNVSDGFYQLLLDESEHVYRQVLVSIPAASNYDCVNFRINFIPANEVAVVNQFSVYNFMYLMVSSSDHVSPLAGLVTSVSVSRDGSNFSHQGSPAPMEIGLGFYSIEVPLIAEVPRSDFNNECVYLIKATATNADITYDSFQVFRYDYPA